MADADPAALDPRFRQAYDVLLTSLRGRNFLGACGALDLLEQALGITAPPSELGGHLTIKTKVSGVGTFTPPAVPPGAPVAQE